MRDFDTTHPRAADLVSWANGSEDERVASHLRHCERCRRVVDDWRTVGQQVSEVLREEADEAFPSEQLARQRADVMRRIRRGGQARVLPFPAAATNAPARGRVWAESRRWAAAAALAGLLVGTLAGRFLLDPQSARRAGVADAPGAATVRPALSGPPVSDEAFLVELDAAVFSSSPRALRALDALTPGDDR